jgi:hypothetical protein
MFVRTAQTGQRIKGSKKKQNKGETFEEWSKGNKKVFRTQAI